MASFSEIIESNVGQKVSEIDPFTKGRYAQFVPPDANDVLDVGKLCSNVT